MRMSRLEWLAQFFRPRVKAKPAPREKRPKKKPATWEVWFPSLRRLDVVAMTKSEARAEAKRQIGGRLPVGTVVVKVVG